jgi:UDP-N-acetylglucosamine--N-acetylmuramyl-(pentapeptide) pyrophosphoryl-undecaprenol N-acetylglucosamine transferase
VVSERRAVLSPELRERYIVRGYLDDMPAAMIAADLVVSRAGASTLGELPAAGAPSILVPGEYEGGRRRRTPIISAAPGRRRGAATTSWDRLAATAIELLDDERRLRRMRAARRAGARPNAARDSAHAREAAA